MQETNWDEVFDVMPNDDVNDVSSDSDANKIKFEQKHNRAWRRQQAIQPRRPLNPPNSDGLNRATIRDLKRRGAVKVESTPVDTSTD